MNLICRRRSSTNGSSKTISLSSRRPRCLCEIISNPNIGTAPFPNLITTRLPTQREYTISQQSTVPSHPPLNKRDRHDLSDIHEHSEGSELLSDLDDMINNIPSDEEPDPRFSPAAQSTPRDALRDKNKNLARDLFQRDPRDNERDDGVSPVRGLKSAQRTPAANKTPGKTVDFKDTSVSTPTPFTLFR